MDWALFFLVVVFGSSTWMGTNSVWMQLPLLTITLPEHWGLPSSISVVVQIACIAPLLYGLLSRFCRKIPTAPLVFGSLVFASACQLGLVFFWQDTITVNGKGVSLALLLLLFGLAMVDSLSSVLFMPFMASFHSNYLNAYFIGMGFSALLPSVLSLAQGISRMECVMKDGQLQPEYFPPRFSVAIFFLVVFIWTVFAGISFLYLYKVKKNNDRELVETSPPSESEKHLSSSSSSSSESVIHEVVKEKPKALSGFSLVFILSATVLVNAQMNGIITSVQSYAALPYSQDTYHYGVTFSNVVAPLASFIPFFFVVRSLPVLGVLTAASTLTTAFIVYLAALSPHRIFDSETAGGALSITAVLLAAGLHSYLRLVFATLLNEGEQSEKRLFWCGACIQIGSFVGSVVMYPLVNIWHVFKDAPTC